MTWLLVPYAVIAWLVLIEGARVATGGAELVLALVEAPLWPLIVVLAHLGLLVDAVRTR